MTQVSLVKNLATLLVLITLACVAFNGSDDHSIGSIDTRSQDNCKFLKMSRIANGMAISARTAFPLIGYFNVLWLLTPYQKKR